MRLFLLPYYFKFIGFAITTIGLFFGILYLFFDFRFSMPVFVIYSQFIEAKMFTSFRTNFADELVLLLLLLGLFFLTFSKEKNEFENINEIRYKSLMKSLFFNFIFLFLSVLFIFGLGFIAVLIINMFSFTVFYLIFFNIQKKSIKT